MKKILDNIKEERLSRNITQQQMADMLEIHHMSYVFYESGRTNISVKRLIEVLNILGLMIEIKNK